MSLLSLILPTGKNGLGYSSTAEQVTQGISLEGKTFLLTGCSSGLGYETMRVLALRGARVLGAARSIEKARDACATVKGQTVPVSCELSDPASVRQCVKMVSELLTAEGTKLDGIICNAGIMALPELQQAHGFELQFFTNHIGHFILVTGLLDSLADQGRVVMLSSGAHMMAPKGGIQFDNLSGEKSYRSWTAYGQSKFANLLFAKELHHRFQGTQKTAYAVHPGVIQTNLGRHMPSIQRLVFGWAGPVFLKSVQQGAATQTYVATSAEALSQSGQYFANSNLAKCRSDADQRELAQRLWTVSEEIVSKI